MKIIIIGGGYAGLAAGALLAKTGHEVQLYEAHTYVGGCASFFKRKHFKFDAGATTLSGLGPGRPLKTLLDILDLDLDYKKLDVPMEIHLAGNKSFKRHASLKTHIKTMEEEFPGLPHQEFWTSLKKREEDLWAILSAGQYFPPKSLSDLKSLITPELIKRTPLALWAFTPFKKTMPKSMQKNPEFMDFINEQLLISTQGHADSVPALLAAMGLIYPDDMYYTDGGMVTLAEKLSQFIEDKGGKVHLRRPVKKVSRQENGLFEIEIQGPMDKLIYDQGDVVISNLTVWDTPKILDETLKKNYPTFKRRGAWGAITAYFAIKSDTPLLPLYHQLHYEVPWAKKGSFFFSFSHPEDNERCPQGWQTVTVSTHTLSEDWYNTNGPESYPESYEDHKEKFKELILESFKKIPNSEMVTEFSKVEIGTPKTFERFTRRHHGLVGGLPHNLRNNILTFPSQETPIENFYQIGDTTFPGQGVVGVVTGALMLAGKINNTNYLK
jgi:C-3',4' desaturase CrtD